MASATGGGSGSGGEIDTRHYDIPRLHDFGDIWYASTGDGLVCAVCPIMIPARRSCIQYNGHSYHRECVKCALCYTNCINPVNPYYTIMTGDDKRGPKSSAAQERKFADHDIKILCWGCSLPTPPPASAAASASPFTAAGPNVKSKSSKPVGLSSAYAVAGGGGGGSAPVPVIRSAPISTAATSSKIDLKSSPPVVLR